ncbi:unnamed protein product [Plutella xylostella]|uniref:(diamondback moth) hypothetical protein n=1 Tax=Plutella xylostella TaxID=51655 RepID=A0A8S4G045_PLUXY|nr:unnamed protein product [Plutella xylostella]
MGQMKIQSGYLDVVIPIDVSYIRPHINNLNEVLGTTRFLCRDVLDNTECHNMLEPITVRFHDAIRDFEAIAHLMPNPVKRSAWFGGIGTVFKHVFGTLDQNDAARYDDAINLIQGDQTKIASIMKNNILVTNSVLQNYKDTFNVINVNEAKLKISLDKISTLLSNLTLVSNKLLYRAAINDVFSLLESSLLTLSFKIEDVVNSIALISSNVLHPSVITPAELYEDLVKTHHHIPTSKHLPIDLYLQNMNTLINISKLLCYYMDNKVVFVLKIPLVSNKIYNLYHSIPLPLPHNLNLTDSFVMIVPTYKYIAVTLDKTRYSNFDDLQHCKHMINQNYICEIFVIHDSSTNPICEIEILTKPMKTVPKQCNIKFIHGYIDIWQPMKNSKWIFTQSVPSKLSIQCHENMYELNVFGTGILTLPNQCVGFCKNTQLIPSIPVYSMNITRVENNFNIINDSCCNMEKFLKTSVPRDSLNNYNLEKIKEFPEIQVKPILKDLDQMINRQHMVKYGTHYSIMFWITLVLVIVFFFVFMFKFGRSRYLNNYPLNAEISPENINVSTLSTQTGTSPAPHPRLRNDL